MAILKVEDIINKKEELKRESVEEVKTTNIHSQILDGELEFHSVKKGDIKDFRERAKTDPDKAKSYFIYISSDILRDKTLLKAFGCEKNQYLIVDKVFPREAETEKVLEILLKLNGIIDPEGLYIKEVEETKN
jgi:hypothetical protein